MRLVCFTRINLHPDDRRVWINPDAVSHVEACDFWGDTGNKTHATIIRGPEIWAEVQEHVDVVVASLIGEGK